MAIFEAEAVHGLDFFHRVFGIAGTSGDRLPQARGGSLEMASGAPRPDRFFHTSPQKERESLYLSLSFFEALSRLIFPRIETLGHPDLGLSLEALHITFTPRFSCLPLLWTFEIAWIDQATGGRAEGGIAVPGEAPFYGLFSLGVLQCAALLARSHPRAETLQDAVAALVRQVAGHGAGVRAMEDVFRSAAAGPGAAWPEPEAALFLQAFQLGVDLSAAGLSGESPPRGQFLGRLEALKAEAWKGLFEIPAPHEAEAEREEDAAIHAVLAGLMARWQEAAPTAVDAEDLERMVALGAPPVSEAEDLERTVALGAPPVSEAEDLERTVALGAAGGGRFESPPPSGDDGLPETVAARRMAGREGKRPTEPETEADDDIVVETVILRPTGRPERRRGG